MRILPYFQSIQPAPKAVDTARTEKAVRPENTAEVFRLPEDTQPLKAPQAEDGFVPASPVAGVVFSLSPEARAGLAAAAKAAPEERSGAVVKSGQYGFYRLDGRANRSEPVAKGEKLDLLS